MSASTTIKTTKTIYPQIYAYVTPGYEPNEGWIKIGYTELKDVDERIRQQTQTANVQFARLWSGPAKFSGVNEWFKDKQFHAYLRRFKAIEQRPNSEWFYYDGFPQQAHQDFKEFRNRDLSQVDRELEYTLRTEQEAAVAMTLQYAAAHKGGEFLWNAKPRFGKTLTTYELARRMQAHNILIVTNRPAIANSWFDEFTKFIAWQTDYRFVSTSDSLKDRPVLTREEYTAQLQQKSDGSYPGCLAFISLQDLKGAISFGGMYDKLKWVKELKWDLLVIDEAHEGVDTFKTDVAFDNITRAFTLHLSGTPFRVVASGKFSDKQIFNWTYADEQAAKAAWPQDSEEHNPYASMPCLNLFSYRMSQMITDEVNQGAQIGGREVDYAFDLNEFFATNDSGRFVHEEDVQKWLDTLSKNEKYPFSTPELRAEIKHSFWLLNRVASAKALARLLGKHPVFERYAVVIAAGDGKGEEDDQIINQKSLDKVREAIKKHTQTITLSVGQLTTGVTVPEWTAIVMLSNVKSPSLYMQAAFRSQNPWSYEVKGVAQRKQNAYIFDFAPERTLTLYDNFANNLYSQTVDGGGTSDERRANILQLLNFFPVIAEDDGGKMVALNVEQVLTIPKVVMAQEVVRRGFMSNLLFQNIAGIFTSEAAREILEKLNPVDQGKVTPRTKPTPIDTQGVQVDEKGEVTVDQALVISTTDARFGEKLYGITAEESINNSDQDSNKLAGLMADAFVEKCLPTAKELAQENAVTVAQAEQIIKKNAAIIKLEVQRVQKQAEIEKEEATVTYNREVAAAAHDRDAIEGARERFKAKTEAIDEKLQNDLTVTVKEKSKEQAHKTTKEILEKGEERKKTTVEDDIRARLRGFARTIPSFLMAYGEVSTTLDNFDAQIDDDVFQEVTGITLDQFRALRDTYNFFNEVVFDESIQEFLRKREELSDYFEESQSEDIFDYIPPQKTNQIFTPKWVVKLMLDKLEEEDPDLFTNKERTFADLYVKSGLFLTEVVKRLYVGLADQIPDGKARLKHILEKQVYGFAPSAIIHAIAKNFIFGNFAHINNSHLECRDLTEVAKNGDDLAMKFDVVVGNPPYQEERENTSDASVYHHFYNLAMEIAEQYCLISPARFLFNAGNTPEAWNQKMLNDENVKVVFYEQNPEKIFPNTDVKGGIAMLYRHQNKCNTAIGTFIPFQELKQILKKVVTVNFNPFNELIFSPESYRLSRIFHEKNPEAKGLLSKGHLFDVTTNIFERLSDYFYKENPNDGYAYIQIYGRLKNNRIYKWIKREYVEQHANLERWKVFVPKSNGSGAIGEVLSTPLVGQPLVGQPLVGHTQSFISIGSFETKYEAESCLKYVKSKFVRTMLGILKVTQDNKKNTWAKVPLQDFTAQSDIDWSKPIPEIDQQLYAKYGLTKREIAFIEEKVKAME